MDTGAIYGAEGSSYNIRKMDCTTPIQMWKDGLWHQSHRTATLPRAPICHLGVKALLKLYKRDLYSLSQGTKHSSASLPNSPSHLFYFNSFRRTLRYKNLPPQLLRLSVLKLDGSSFEVQVARTATVAAVRDAVESVFCGMSTNNEDVKISWPHVWGHFCLCYKHFKLIDDKSRIKHFGIRDGDQSIRRSVSKLLKLLEEEKNRRKNGYEDPQVI
ncbi:unnamed protein product [Citrullus colocynthis]|uniref:SNRNP25 ubiquitin-like domain-containing protein n=1 Tax=Citrullus colocynthis TaxID=252529 RepID=A0ABP0ZC26_9ROSI